MGNVLDGYDRLSGKDDTGNSVPLQVGRAGEHLVCAELLLQGWNAFLAPPGCPYDIIVDRGNGLFCRVQVKSTVKMMDRGIDTRNLNGSRQAVYRFALRRSRTHDRRIRLDDCDYLAFVSLDTRVVAFLPVAAFVKADGFVVCLVEFKSRRVEYKRVGLTGKDPAKCGRFLEDYTVFNPDLVSAAPAPATALL